MSLAPLATEQDVVDRLGRALSAVEAARVAAYLKDASASVRRFTGQQMTAATADTARLRAHQRRVRLPQRPVTAVHSVGLINDMDGTVIAMPLGTWRWDGVDVYVAQRMLIVNGPDWTAYPWNNFSLVDVNYDHGYRAIPDDVVGIVAQVVLRALGVSPTSAGITTETVDGYTFQKGTIAAAGPFGLLPDEKEALTPYRRPPPVASVW